MNRRDILWAAICETLARNVPSDYEGVKVDKKGKKGKKDGESKKNSKKS